MVKTGLINKLNAYSLKQKTTQDLHSTAKISVGIMDVKLHTKFFLSGWFFYSYRQGYRY